jgi:hypothetical protein
MRFFAGDHYTFLSLALHFVSKKPLNMCNDIRVTLCTCEWEWHSDSGFVHLAPCLSLCQSLIVSIKDMKQGHPPGAARGECDVKKTGAAQVVLLKREENSRCVANNLVFAFVKRWQSQLCEKLCACQHMQNNTSKWKQNTGSLHPTKLTKPPREGAPTLNPKLTKAPRP